MPGRSAAGQPDERGDQRGQRPERERLRPAAERVLERDGEARGEHGAEHERHRAAPRSAGPSPAWKRVRISTGSSAWAIAIATPIASPAANSDAVVPSPRSPVPAAVSSAQATSARSIGTRAAIRGAIGANAPMHRTGSVVSTPAAAAERPRSARMSATSGVQPRQHRAQVEREQHDGGDDRRARAPRRRDRRAHSSSTRWAIANAALAAGTPA